MKTINVDLSSGEALNLLVGRQGESGVTQVVFDFSALKTEFGTGTVSLSVKRPKESTPYAQTITTSGTNATWLVNETDTGVAGCGEIQLTYTVNSQIAKTVVFKYTVYPSIGVDGEYPIPGQTWQQEIEEDISEIREDLSQLEGGGLTEDIKQAWLACLRHMPFLDDDDDYYQNMYDALYPPVPPATLSYITCVYTQSGTVYNTDTLDSLKSDLVVTAHYSNGTTQTVTAYILSGSLTVGTSTITVTYGGKTTTFNVTVTKEGLPTGYQEVEWIGFDGNSRIVTDATGASRHVQLETKLLFHQATAEECAVTLCQGAAAKHEIGTSSTANRIFYWFHNTADVTSVSGMYDYPSVISTNYVYQGEQKIDVEVNGNSYTGTNTGSTYTYSDLKFTLGSAGYSSQRSGYKGKLYYAKYYDDGVLKSDLVPCYRTSDDAIGVYDKVTQTFYGNSGTGTLTKGADV